MANWLKTRFIFSPLSDAQRTKLGAAFEEETYADGAEIVKQGDEADSIYFVYAGAVVCSRESTKDLLREEIKRRRSSVAREASSFRKRASKDGASPTTPRDGSPAPGFSRDAAKRGSKEDAAASSDSFNRRNSMDDPSSEATPLAQQAGVRPDRRQSAVSFAGVHGTPLLPRKSPKATPAHPNFDGSPPTEGAAAEEEVAADPMSESYWESYWAERGIDGSGVTLGTGACLPRAPHSSPHRSPHLLQPTHPHPTSLHLFTPLIPHRTHAHQASSSERRRCSTRRTAPPPPR